MKRIFLSAITFFSGLWLSAQADVTLRFDNPATHFTQSLPLGNGRLGAMVFGDPSRERIVLNESSMWSGGVEDPNRSDAHRHLPMIQRLLQKDRNKEAQELLQQAFVSAGKGSGHGRGADVKFGCYQTLGDLWVQWRDTSHPVTGYSRVLQVDKALAVTEWTRGSVRYTEEVWVSAPQQVVVVRLRASKPRALHLDVLLDRRERAQISSTADGITMRGQLSGGDGDEGIRFAAYTKVRTREGRVTGMVKGLKIEGATECLIVLSAATDLNWPQVELRGGAPLPVAQKRVTAAAALAAPVLLQNHIADYQSYFNRCRLRFSTPAPDSLLRLTTPQRLVRYAAGGSDASLPALYFHFGRYLLISSSRPGGLPANLQGLWAEEYQTPWNGDYHLNINVQMNYWPAEVTNLAELHEPLLEFTGQLVEPGRKTAKAYYNSRGWTAHMMSNPWKFTAPGESATWGSSLTGGAWLCRHLWQHYTYYPDRGYLAAIYPVLKGAAQFYTDILVEDPATGWLVTAPSNSPENTYITEEGFAGQTTMGPTMDMQIGRELLGNTLAAASILGVDKAWADSLRQIRERLAPNQVSQRTGGIQEWIRDYKEAEPGHRHVSHLYGLYPFDDINTLEPPRLAGAARITLERRGDGGTGWSKAWKIAFWARLGEGDRALSMLKGLLKPAFTVQESHYKMSGAGTYPNLFCAHPPFQIDGNLGATAALAEMLLQSTGRNAVIRLLPALPSASEWSSGTINGLRAPKGFEVEMAWNKSRLSRAVILSRAGLDCFLQLPVGLNVYDAKGKKIKVKSLNNRVVSFSTTRGGRYILK